MLGCMEFRWTRKMRWVGQEAHIGEMRIMYKTLSENLHVRDCLEDMHVDRIKWLLNTLLTGHAELRISCRTVSDRTRKFAFLRHVRFEEPVYSLGFCYFGGSCWVRSVSCLRGMWPLLSVIWCGLELQESSLFDLTATCLSPVISPWRMQADVARFPSVMRK
jgi:hypothetical protein